MVSDFGVTTTSLRTVVLGERSLLGRVVVRVVADDVADQQGVGQTVRNVELGTQFVSHGVAHTQEGVGERDTGDGGSIVHLLTSDRVVGTVQVAGRQVLFQHFQGLQRLTVGVLVGQYGNIGFHGVSHGIDTTEGTQGLRHTHDQVGINDGHVRGQLVVSQRILLTRHFIGYYCKRSDFRAGTGSGGDTDQFGLHAHFRELVDTLADVHEAHGQIFERSVRVLVHHPHDLGSIHR